MEKWYARKFVLKFEFYNTDRKMKRTIRCIFISIIMHPNFMCFRQKISFKSALKIFTPVSGHLRTALTCTIPGRHNLLLFWCQVYPVLHFSRFERCEYLLNYETVWETVRNYFLTIWSSERSVEDWIDNAEFYLMLIVRV